MIRSLVLALAGVLSLTSCSSVGVYSLQKNGARVHQAPSQILVQPFSAPASVFSLGDRPESEKRALRSEIVANLARSTAIQLRTHAAASTVVSDSGQIRPGSWVLRGEIRRVDQGSRALRATVGLGAGRTEMRTRVTLCNVTTGGLVPILRFNTTGNSGMEPGAALGVATGGASLVATGGSVLMGSLPGVSSDIDRTSYEISAVISAYLQRNGLLDASRRAISPNMRGQVPTTMNLNRAVPAPLRGQE
jgi:Domain of unknown function (DUF4410)